MRKFILEVSHCGNEKYVSIHHNSSQSPFTTCLRRQSPIYSASELEHSEIPYLDGDFTLLFCFTYQSFRTIGRLQRQFSELTQQNQVFLSHGIASVILISDQEETLKNYLTSVDDLLIGHELWTIKGGKIDHETNNILEKYCDIQNSTYQLDDSELSIDYQNIFRGLVLTLNQARSLSSVYAKEFIFLFDDTYRLAQEIVIKLLFLKDKISAEVFEANLKLINRNWSQDDLQKQVDNNIIAKSDPKERIIRIQQLKDESIQLSAIVQNVLRQAFSSVCPILSSWFEAGEHSLLGIGGAYSAIVAINNHIRKAFSICADVEGIAKVFKDLPAPPLPDPCNYASWRNELFNFGGISKAIPYCEKKEQTSHLVYFSNRLGFRETKHSITTAIQAIMLSALPSWNMCTVFHEYMHAL